MVRTVIFVAFVLCCEGRYVANETPQNEVVHQDDDLNLESIPDKILDFVLAEVRHYLNSRNETSMPLPDISMGFNQCWLGIDVYGEFTARHGSFSNPATIIRKGPCTHRVVNDTFIFTMDVGFANMEIYFDHYDVSMFGLHDNGSVSLLVGKNTVFLEISVRYLPHCVVQLTQAELRELSDIDAQIQGLGVFNVLADDIVSWIVSHYRSSFNVMLEAAIKAKLEEELRKTSLCHLRDNTPQVEITPTVKDS